MKRPILTLAVLALAAGAAAADVVRMGTEGAYPPFNFINQNNQLEGFEIDLGNELCRRAELTCEWVITDWDGIIPNLVAGNFDTIIAGMSITEERAQVISFTQNYTPPATSRYVGLSEDADINGIVAAQVNTIQASHIASETDATLIEFATPDETIAAVRTGQADVVFADGEFLVPIVRDNPDLFFVGDPVPLGGGVGMGLRQSDVELRERFDAAITSMKEDGSLNELIRRWFGEDAEVF